MKIFFSKRFDNHKTVQPGPGAYNDPRTAFTSLNKIASLKRHHFLKVQFDSMVKLYTVLEVLQVPDNTESMDSLRKTYARQ